MPNLDIDIFSTDDTIPLESQINREGILPWRQHKAHCNTWGKQSALSQRNAQTRICLIWSASSCCRRRTIHANNPNSIYCRQSCQTSVPWISPFLRPCWMPKHSGEQGTQHHSEIFCPVLWCTHRARCLCGLWWSFSGWALPSADRSRADSTKIAFCCS